MLHFTYRRVGVKVVGFAGIVTGMSATIFILLRSAIEKLTIMSRR
jgi:hypothetical protein